MYIMFHNINLGKKLAIAFLLMIVLALCIASAGYYGMTQVMNTADELSRDAIPSLKAILTISDSQRGILGAERALIDKRLSSPEAKAQQYKYMAIQWTRIDEQWKIYESMPMSEEEVQLWQTISNKWPKWKAEHQRVVDLMKEQDELIKAGGNNEKIAANDEAAFQASSSARLTYLEIQPVLDNLVEVVQTRAVQASDHASAAYVLAQRILFIALLGGIAIMLLFGFYLTRNITRPVKELSALMARAGNGDFTVQGHVTSRDEIGQLVKSFNQMLEHQRMLVLQARQTAEGLSSASDQLAASSEEVSTTATEIAKNVQTVAQEAETGNSSVLDISKVMLEMSSLIQLAKNHANEAGGDSGMMQEAAKEGKVTVSEAIKRMGNIREKTLETENLIHELSNYSGQIGAITDTITQIADQTNLLALNAAIEAARAGETGRGFAVVAEEVRKLAEQSSKGAAEVATLISKVTQGTNATVEATVQSQKEVEFGVETVSQVGQALEKILDAITRTVKNTEEIVKVTDDEVASSDKIVKMINTVATGIETTAAHSEEVSAAVQETSATMETIAASAQEMMAMSHELTQSVEKFVIDKKQEGGPICNTNCMS